MFGSQAMRLLRSTWTGQYGAKRLAQELFAMFQDDIPLEHNAPVTLHQTGDGPALDVRRKPGSDGPLIRFGNRTTTYPGMPDIRVDDSGIDLADDGGMILRAPYLDVQTDEGGSPVRRKVAGDGSPSPTIKVTGGGGGFPGQVTAGGPGDVYTVDVYENGLASPPLSRSVKQLLIAADATIPAGTWVTVNTVTEQPGGTTTRFMQTPVWLEDLTP